MKNLLGFLVTVLLFATVARGQDPPFTETLRSKADTRLAAYKPVNDISGNLSSVGTDTMEKLMKLWIEEFTKTYPKLSISLEAKSSGQLRIGFCELFDPELH